MAETIVAIPSHIADTPTRRSRLRPGMQMIVGAMLLFLVNGAVFGSGYYLKWVDPVSGVGTLVAVMRMVLDAPRDHPLVIVMGDSRVGEGFSGPLATQEARRLDADYVFLNSAVPGTSPRVWYYMLRRYWRQGLRPAAVIVMTASVRDEANGADPNRVYDLAFVHPLLRLTDLVSFPATYSHWNERWEAAETILLRGRSFRSDLEDLMLEPAERINRALVWRAHGGEFISNYPGTEGSFAGVHLDLATGDLAAPTGAPPFTPQMIAYARDLARTKGAPAETAEAHDYRRDWYGAIAGLCARMGAKLIVFRIPRGPFHSAVGPGPEPDGALPELAAAGELTLMRRDAFSSLERPDLFRDQLHLNRTGREMFSPLLAREFLSIADSRRNAF